MGRKGGDVLRRAVMVAFPGGPWKAAVSPRPSGLIHYPPFAHRPVAAKLTGHGRTVGSLTRRRPCRYGRHGHHRTFMTLARALRCPIMLGLLRALPVRKGAIVGLEVFFAPCRPEKPHPVNDGCALEGGTPVPQSADPVRAGGFGPRLYLMMARSAPGSGISTFRPER